MHIINLHRLQRQSVILEEDEAAEEKRRQAHEARLERERELMVARHMRDSVRRDQIDIALEPDEPDL